MNKTQLIESISSEAGISRGEAKRSLEAFMKITTAALISGEKVTLAGFGTFAIERKHARTGRDPRNGAPIRIAAKNVVKFRPGIIRHSKTTTIFRDISRFSLEKTTKIGGEKGRLN